MAIISKWGCGLTWLDFEVWDLAIPVQIAPFRKICVKTDGSTPSKPSKTRQPKVHESPGHGVFHIITRFNSLV